MNGTERRIEIFKPFGEAFDLMQTILFRPFDFKKWLVIGFAAFLSGHFGGGSFNFPSQWGRHPAGTPTFNPSNFEQWKPWLPMIIVTAVVVVVALIIVFTWLKARGNFIFTDCIVRNRAAIAAPWHEYRKEGNSYFLFHVAVIFGALILFGLCFALIAGFGFLPNGHQTMSATAIALLVLLVCCWIAFWFIFALLMYFMPFVMYRQRCLAVDAFREVLSLIASNLGSFILLCLFGFVLLLATVVIGIIATCATCCLAAIPYVGSVILLPVSVCLRAFGLCFLRQFGPDYDVWQTMPQPEPPPITLPPIPPA